MNTKCAQSMKVKYWHSGSVKVRFKIGLIFIQCFPKKKSCYWGSHLPVEDTSSSPRSVPGLLFDLSANAFLCRKRLPILGLLFFFLSFFLFSLQGRFQGGGDEEERISRGARRAGWALFPFCSLSILPDCSLYPEDVASWWKWGTSLL